MNFTKRFRATLEDAHTQLAQLPLEKIRQRPAPDKWSPIEIMGHLIDSANNNHRRFVKALWQENMIFNGYEQENWVTYQKYQEADWHQILDLWKVYNLHICQIIENTPEEKLNKEVSQHNLHQIAWKTVPQDQSVTLGYFMRDYIGHITHHLQQIKDTID